MTQERSRGETSMPSTYYAAHTISSFSAEPRPHALRRLREQEQGTAVASRSHYVTRSTASEPQEHGADDARGGTDEEGEPHLLRMRRHAEDVVEAADERRADAVGHQVDHGEEDADAEAAQVRAGDVVYVGGGQTYPHDGQAVEEDVQQKEAGHLVGEEQRHPEGDGEERRARAEGHASACPAAARAIGEVAAGDRHRYADDDRQQAADG